LPDNDCAAVAAANSFVYLQNEYPGIYGQALVPDNQYVNGQPSTAALISTADLLASPNYMNIGAGGSNPVTAIPGKVSYIEACAPNTTVNNVQLDFYGHGYGQDGPVTPTWQFIYSGLLNNSVVDISIWGGVNHFLTVTGFHWTDFNNDGVIDPSDKASIDVVDPWTGMNETFPIWQTVAGGPINISYQSSYTSNVPEVSQILSAIATSPAHWNSPGSASWSSTSSWLGRVPDGPGIKANFLNSATSATTVTLDSPRTVGALNFDSPCNYSLVTVGSSTLTLSQPGGAATIAVSDVFGDGAHTIAVPLVLASPLIVTQNASSPLTISGPISDGGNGYSLTMTGSGITILTGSNTFSGGTSVTAGTLILASNSAILNGSSLTVGADGTFVFDPSATSIPYDDLNLTVGANTTMPFDSLLTQSPMRQNALSGETTVTLVREPGTSILLLVAGLAFFLYATRHDATCTGRVFLPATAVSQNFRTASTIRN